MANSSPSIAIEAHDLVKVFPRGNVRALDGVSLQVETGTVLGLLGPNGAGKTTAVRILSTILEPDEGRAAILGHDVAKEPEVVRRIIGLAGQYATVDENLSGRENIRMVGRLSHLSRRTAASGPTSCSRRSGSSTPATASSRPTREACAAASTWPPPSWPARRCSSSTSPRPASTPRAARTSGGSSRSWWPRAPRVLLTTQYLEEADRLARDIVVVDHGLVIAQGTPAELKADLGTSVVSVTLGYARGGDRGAAAADAALGQGAAWSTTLIVELTVENGPAVGAEVLRALDGASIPVTGMALREPSLDDVFLSLTGHKTEAETEADRAARKSSGRRRGGADETDGKDAA